nr:immunoglobulin heavy chain junction region [Mus musculus]
CAPYYYVSTYCYFDVW